MYKPVAGPYCYPGSPVLKNIPGHTVQGAVDRFEAVATGRRFLEPMPTGRWSVRHYRAIHRHIFQDVYAWAGRDRTSRISKGSSTFCYPEHISRELHRVFGKLRADGFCRGLTVSAFADQTAHFLAELNAIHPFRDGNGRTQLTFLTLLTTQAGHRPDLERLDPQAFLEAMIASFHGVEELLAAQIRDLIA